MKKQQAQFIADKFLDRFKSNYTLVDKNTLPVLEEILAAAGLEFNIQAVDNLNNAGNVDTGKLAELNTPLVYVDSNKNYILEVGYPITSEQAKYYDYINKGVEGVGGLNAKLNATAGIYKFRYKKPSKKMVLAIQSWINRAGISSRYEDQKKGLSKLQTKRLKLAKAVSESSKKNRLAYVISKAIKRDGIKASYYFDNAVKNVFNEDFKKSLEVALKNDVLIQIISLYGSNSTR